MISLLFGIVDCIKPSSSNRFKWFHRNDFSAQGPKKISPWLLPSNASPCASLDWKKSSFLMLQAADLLSQAFPLSLSVILCFRISLRQAAAFFFLRPCPASFRKFMFRAIFWVLRRGLRVQHIWQAWAPVSVLLKICLVSFFLLFWADRHTKMLNISSMGMAFAPENFHLPLRFYPLLQIQAKYLKPRD